MHLHFGARMAVAKIGSRGLGGARGFTRAEHDFYPTDPALTRALLSVEFFRGGRIWEPACGDGAMSEILAERHKVVSTDLQSLGYGRGGMDFLKAKTLRAENIVTNPPFNLWMPFAQKALDLGAEKVALLGRLLLLEGWERSEFFRKTHLTRVWVVGRGKMLPPGAEDKGHSGMICFAWFVWSKGYTGMPSIHWHKPAR